MTAIPLATAEARLQEYLDAESKILLGQATAMNGRSLTRANLDSVRDGIKYWADRVDQASAAAAGRRRVRNASPSW